jgi:hypothetical protein
LYLKLTLSQGALSRPNDTLVAYPARQAVDHRGYPGWNRDALLFLVGVDDSVFVAGHWRPFGIMPILYFALAQIIAN